ncbi:hypothetical protein PIB30_053241 [Stylosanthes scabra]|uniref:Methyltransferase n=1 Tax=Stylosanthes scabra TaxID=79078 RepID=A0ABU6XG72_9FABA|nr:hypothetical protein [Stylosanthes scabra]
MRPLNVPLWGSTVDTAALSLSVFTCSSAKISGRRRRGTIFKGWVAWMIDRSHQRKGIAPRSMSEVKNKLDFLLRLGPDMSMKILTHLDDPCDLLRISTLSRADAYIDELTSVIPIAGGSIRTALDTGCGVASWGAYMLKRNVLTMFFAPKDNHETQVQFALERGVPTVIGVLGTMHLPYPARAFYMAQCSRCLQNTWAMRAQTNRLLNFVCDIKV